jgi:hypothetical protein
MTKKALRPEQAWNAMYMFLKGFLDQKEGYVNAQQLEIYLSFAERQFEEDYDWRRVFVRAQGKGFSFEDRILSEQLFSMMILVITKYQEKYGLDLSTILKQLHAMKEFPTSYELEWTLWREALGKSYADRRWGLPDYLYPPYEGSNT